MEIVNKSAAIHEPRRYTPPPRGQFQSKQSALVRANAEAEILQSPFEHFAPWRPSPPKRPTRRRSGVSFFPVCDPKPEPLMSDPMSVILLYQLITRHTSRLILNKHSQTRWIREIHLCSLDEAFANSLYILIRLREPIR